MQEPNGKVENPRYIKEKEMHERQITEYIKEEIRKDSINSGTKI